jgi:hypothetical protein
VIIEADFSILKKCKPKKKPKVVGDKTKVSPMITNDTINNRIKQSAELRKIRLEYGAGSKEYLDAVNDIQQ